MRKERERELFVTCNQGLETLLEEELRSLGFAKTKQGYRGVFIPFHSLSDVYRVNYCSRIASRVLLPLLKFRCRGPRDLYSETQKIEWNRYFSADKTFAIDANVTHSMLRNSLYAAQVMKDAICDQFNQNQGKRPSIDVKNPQVQLNLYIHDDFGVISYDTSGTPLHKRGYRLEGGDAPLQENLAAALLRLAGYEPEVIFCDPCMGSGTFLIEAALMASQTPPGFLRTTWGFMQLPDFDTVSWLKVKNEADAQRKPLQPKHFFGCDKGKEMVRIAKINFRAAGFLNQIEVIQSDFRDYQPPVAPNFIIANPPHGIRLDDTQYLKSLYRNLGDFLKLKSQKPGKGFVFVGNLDLAKEVGLAPKQRHVMFSGGIECRFLEFELY